jgi:hypothetical protein
VTLPNFLVIGASKSGTTSLYYYLQQHPDVYMSPVKEPRFFALEGRKLDFRGPGAQERINRWAVTDIEEYRALFEGVEGEKAIGEASPTYLHSPQAPGRIKHYVPEARLIALLRNPVQRAYSAYVQHVRDGREPLSFSEALREEEGRLRDNWSPGWGYKRIGFYHRHLKRYYEMFGEERIKVYLYEELSEDPVGVSRDIFRFLGVDDAFEPDTSLRHNPSGIPRSRALLGLVKRPNAVKSALKPLLPGGVRKRISVNVQNWMLEKAPPLPEEARGELAEAYREDILGLQDLIGRDLSGWLDEPRRTGK